MLRILETNDVVFHKVPDWMKDGQMAVVPYRDKEGLHLIGRGYTIEEGLPVYKSHLFVADGEGHFTFKIRPDPLLSPATISAGEEVACEDPTLVETSVFGRNLFYSQVRLIRLEDIAATRTFETDRFQVVPEGIEFPKGSAEDLGVFVSLGIAGLAGRSTFLEPTAQVGWWSEKIDMCKEAEILPRSRPQDLDVVFFEFADRWKSHIGVTFTDLEKLPPSASGTRPWLLGRVGMWDGGHVSTGPVIPYGEKCLMFYNGRNHESEGKPSSWCIGEVVFDPETLEKEYRSETPIILPTDEIGWKNQRIAFASGALVEDGKVYLYYHEADKRVRCAVGILD